MQNEISKPLCGYANGIFFRKRFTHNLLVIYCFRKPPRRFEGDHNISGSKIFISLRKNNTPSCEQVKKKNSHKRKKLLSIKLVRALKIKAENRVDINFYCISL